MRKIMLVIDDFNELLALENFLRRMGFDVLSLGRDLLVSDALLRFVPDIAFITAKGRLVDGVRLAQRLKRQVGGVHVALLHPAGQAPVLPADVATTVDALVESPFQVAVVIRLLSVFAGIDPAPLIEKYEKISSTKFSRDEMQIVSSDEKGVVGAAKDASHAVQGSWDPVSMAGQAAAARSERSDRYQKFLEENSTEPVDGVLPHGLAHAAMEKLKKDSAPEKAELDRLDEEKRAFAKTLFEAASDEDGQGKAKS